MKVKSTYLVFRQQARRRDAERHRRPQGGEGDADGGRGTSHGADEAAAPDEARPPRDAAQQAGLRHRVLRGHAAQEAVPVLHAQRSLVPERHGSGDEEQGGKAQERAAGGEAGKFSAAVPPHSPDRQSQQQLLRDPKNQLLQEGQDRGSDQLFLLLCSQSQKLWERWEEVENGSGFYG